MALQNISRNSLIYKILLILLTSSRMINANDVNFEILEQQDVGTIIGDIVAPSGLADKYPQDVIDRMQFSILSDSATEGISSYFSINSNNGELSASKVIDRETVCRFKTDCILTLSIAARTVQPPQYFESITVHVSIIDINDNQPRFPNPVVNLIIPENTEISSTFPLPEAIDPDSGANAVQSYNLNPNSQQFGISTIFNPDGSMGIQLLVLEKLDREVKDNYKLNLLASDGGTPQYTATALLNITIGDSNDNIATFKQSEYVADIMEDLQVPSIILQVEAVDNDLGDAGKVIYGFTSRTMSLYGDLFEINANTGDIKVLKPLDYEVAKQYTLTVVAKDSAPNARISQATATIYVHDVNDFAPQITINTLTSNGQAEVPENAQIETFVAHLSVVDKDSRLNGQVDCHLNSNKYSLQKIMDTQYKLITASVFDRENASFNTVILTCADQGQPSLNNSKSIHVSILDQNDNAPEFDKTQYSVVIQENNPSDVYITTVKATDKDYGVNARITYSLVESDEASQMFEIDPSTGMIKATKGLDYEEQHDIVLRVMANDSGDPMMSSTTIVQIKLLDVNDNPPQFVQRNGQFNFIIIENQKIGTKIGQFTANDPDSPPNDVIEYKFEGDSLMLQTLFNLDQKTGILTSKSLFDREARSLYQFNVIAYNPDTPNMKSAAAVHVYVEDANDMEPEFVFPAKDNHTLQILPTIQAGEIITQIQAKDGDDGNNAWLSFSIIGGNEDGFFTIGQSNGLVTVTKDLSQSKQDYFNLTIEAKDNGAPPKTSNEWLLIAMNATVPVSEGFPANMIILVCLVSITGILMIFLLVAILFLVYKSRYRNNSQNKYINAGDEPDSKTPPVEIINRLDTTQLHVDLNSSFKEPVYDYRKHSSRPGGQMNSHMSADSGFDEVTISPHGKLVSFRASGPDSKDYKYNIDQIKEDDEASAASEDGSNTDSGCVLSETGADDVCKESRDQPRTNQHYKQPQHTFHPGYIIMKNNKKLPADLYPNLGCVANNTPDTEFDFPQVTITPVKQTVRDIKSKDKMKKLNSNSNWPDVVKFSDIDTHDLKEDNKSIGPPPFTNFYDSNSLMKYKMDPNSQRCASEITDNTSTTSGSYIITGEDVAVC